MIILAIESSAVTASVAILKDNQLVAEYTVNHKKTHSQTLLPMIDEIVSMADMDASEIDVIAVSEGPGSFTGLRIGAATGKGIALALDKKMVSVPTLKAMAYNLYSDDRIIVPIMDARRQHVYAGAYTFDEGRLLTMRESELISIEDLISSYKLLSDKTGKKLVFIGDGVDVAGEKIKEALGDICVLAAPQNKTARAGSVAMLAMSMAKAGEFTDADELKPDYLRPSQAEREKMDNQ